MRQRINENSEIVPSQYALFIALSLSTLSPYQRQDSNLHLLPNQILSLARLPIPPLWLYVGED